MSPKHVTKRLKIPVSTFYNWVRENRIKHVKKGSSYVVLVRDMKDAKEILNKNRESVVRVCSNDHVESHGRPDSMGCA